MKYIYFFVFIFSIAFVAQAQKRITVTGTVTNAAGEPIRRANFFVDSVQIGAKTNKKGQFKLKLAPNTTNITVFEKTYGLVSKMYSGETVVNFKFPSAKEVLSEKELKALGFKIPVRSGSVQGQVVNFDDNTEEIEIYDDIFQLIDRNFSGVQVNGNQIIIKRGGGNGSFGATNPLFIVDGSFVGSISNILPDAVRRIQILRGSDTTIYGTRGNNGVILITLKTTD